MSDNDVPQPPNLFPEGFTPTTDLERLVEWLAGEWFRVWRSNSKRAAEFSKIVALIEEAQRRGDWTVHIPSLNEALGYDKNHWHPLDDDDFGDGGQQ